MKQFRIETTDEFICGNSGLIMVGSLINKPSFKSMINQLSIDDSQKDISNLDILKSYIGLLSLGKNSYESIDEYKNDLFFKESLQIERLPSKESLRQRLESLSTKEVENIIKKFNTELISKFGELHTIKDTDLIPVDFDVSPFDNSNSNKQGVSRTYKQVDGFAPMLTYIGSTGYMLNNEFRKGSAHSNCEGTSEYIEKTIEYAQSITNKNLLCRFDSGNDSAENIDKIQRYLEVFYLIKKNFRRESQEPYIAFAKSDNATKLKENEEMVKNLSVEDSTLIKNKQFVYLASKYIDAQTSKKNGIDKETPIILRTEKKAGMINEIVSSEIIRNYLLYKNIDKYLNETGSDYDKKLVKQFNKQCTSKDYKEKIVEKTKNLKSLIKGKPAPFFTANDITGKEYSLNDFVGKYVYIDVWATWCGPCLRQLPHLEKLEEEFNLSFPQNKNYF